MSSTDEVMAAAESGYMLAQFHLGLMYENGKGLTKDYKQEVD